MTILVCPLSHVRQVVGARAPERIITLLDPDLPSPYFGADYQGRHLRLSFHDVDVATWDEEVPTVDDVRRLLAFALAWKRDAPLLIHCHSGIGRSPAAALIVACALNPATSELTFARRLRQVAPFVHPNEALIRLADAELGRVGQMLEAIRLTPSEAPRQTRVEGMPFELPAAL
jgi:predicted protein tyrosine phosphatase